MVGGGGAPRVAGGSSRLAGADFAWTLPGKEIDPLNNLREDRAAGLLYGINIIRNLTQTSW